MVLEFLTLCSQQLASGPCPEPDKLSPQPVILLLYNFNEGIPVVFWPNT